MSVILYAHPKTLGIDGFFFRSQKEWDEAYPEVKDRYGDQITAFDIEFIKGDEIASEFAKYWHLTQDNWAQYLEIIATWDIYAKLSFIIAAGHHNKTFDHHSVHSAFFDVDIYFVDTIKDLAHYFIKEGTLGDIPDIYKIYIDQDKFACDLSDEYSTFEIANTKLVYRCA